MLRENIVFIEGKKIGARARRGELREGWIVKGDEAGLICKRLRRLLGAELLLYLVVFDPGGWREVVGKFAIAWSRFDVLL